MTRIPPVIDKQPVWPSHQPLVDQLGSDGIALYQDANTNELYLGLTRLARITADDPLNRVRIDTSFRVTVELAQVVIPIFSRDGFATTLRISHDAAVALYKWYPFKMRFTPSIVPLVELIALHRGPDDQEVQEPTTTSG